MTYIKAPNCFDTPIMQLILGLLTLMGGGTGGFSYFRIHNAIHTRKARRGNHCKPWPGRPRIEPDQIVRGYRFLQLHHEDCTE